VYNSEYTASILPGKNENVTASVLNPTNIAISKYIDEDRKKAAAEFLKYIASKETQKKYLINYFLFSGITELYDDEEVCSVIQCEVIKNAMPFQLMSNDERFFSDDNYHIKYRGNLFDYLYNDKPLDEVLKTIDDITRIYKLTWNKNDDNSKAGFFIFIIFIVSFTCMALSSIFIFIKKFEPYFIFLPKSLWFITILGSLILMSSIITLYGDVTNTSCHIRISLINVGFVLSICPSLHKLITNFPKTNKYSTWVEKNKSFFILIIIFVAGSLNGILAISSFDLQEFTSTDGKNYQKCIMDRLFGRMVYYILLFYEVFIIIISLFLIFIEWNIDVTRLDVKYLATALSMDTLSLILLNIIENINFRNYIIYNILIAINILTFSGFNHLFTYLIRIISPLFVGNEELDIIKSLMKMENISTNDSNVTASSVDDSTIRSNNSKVDGIRKKIIEYHNKTNIS